MSVTIIRKQHIKLPTSIPGPFEVKVGFPLGSVSSHVIDKAIWNHYGTRGGRSGGGWGGPIPARPFLLNSVTRHADKYKEALRVSAKPILRGTQTVPAVLTRLGILAADDIKQEIVNTLSPPNSPTTIRMKGSSHPLIDTGELRNAATWKLGK